VCLSILGGVSFQLISGHLLSSKHAISCVHTQIITPLGSLTHEFVCLSGMEAFRHCTANSHSHPGPT
jgi:hypothetical protein